jgi:hypothetical protein
MALPQSMAFRCIFAGQCAFDCVGFGILYGMAFLPSATQSKMPTPRAFLRSRPCRTRIFLSALLALTLLPVASAQGQSPAPVDAAALVRRAVQHRLYAGKSHRSVRYLIHRTDERHDTTKAIIETVDGGVARLVAINGKPLSAAADRAELDRLDTLAMHPELQEHRHKSEQKDAERVDRLLALLPDAFLYRFEGMTPCAAGQCYRLSFTPNPRFTPPYMEADLLRGIAGEVWIDVAQERLTRLEGHFIAEVNFGFGIIGKLNRGGSVLLEQTDVGGQDWELTRLTLHVTGKALMVKPLSFQINEEANHFTPVSPGLRYRDAIQLLKQSAP